MHKVMFICNTCEELVHAGHLREHLEGHHPSARNFELDEVRDCFHVSLIHEEDEQI